jgi:hypothetical protein
MHVTARALSAQALSIFGDHSRCICSKTNRMDNVSYRICSASNGFSWSSTFSSIGIKSTGSCTSLTDSEHHMKYNKVEVMDYAEVYDRFN